LSFYLITAIGGNQMQVKKLLNTLYIQVLLAIVAGIVLGHLYPKLGENVKPLGDMFINLIKMVITPIVFVTVVLGICGVGDLKKNWQPRPKNSYLF
jgi:aerobic C4-dicarboxylate transport protein